MGMLDSEYDSSGGCKAHPGACRSLKQEMQDLQVANARLDEPRSGKGSYESRLLRLQQIKLELAETLHEFKRTGTD
jgi:hypothetical protein